MTGLNQPLGYFKKSAKALLDAARSGDFAAEERIRAIRDTSPAAMTLMKAQHVVAVEYGFASWSKLLEAEAHTLYAAISRCKGRRKFDQPTQERVRQLIRLLRIEIPEEPLRKPIHILSIYAVAEDRPSGNALERPWGVDIGNYQRMVSERQAHRLMEMCRDEGIPFWQRGWLNAHVALQMPDIYPDEYGEICEQFGVPVPAIEED